MPQDTPISVTFTGFKTPAQAQAFVAWYGAQGEQHIPTWLECRDNLDGVVYMNVDRKIGLTKDANSNITVTLKMES